MQRTDLSLTCIFSALQKPHSGTAQKCKAQVKAASIKEIDYTFRKINQYKKKRQDDWPRTRLLRCIDYVLEHTVKLESVIQLPSVIHCISWTLDHVMNDDPQTSQMAIKVIAKTLERSRPLETSNKNQLLYTVSAKMDPELWLFQHPLAAVRIYALRALVTHPDAFGTRLSACVPQCLHQLKLIPSLLYTLSLRPKVTDYDEKKLQLEQLVMYARLLEGFVVEDMETLWSIWISVAKNHDGVEYKNREILLYSLTSALHRSTTPTSTIHTNTLLYLMDKLMRRWARDVCCSMHPPLCPPGVLEIEAKTLKKCLRIALTMGGDEHRHHLVLGTINFFMCYVGQPVSPEETSTIGTDTCISSDMCVDVDERGYTAQPVPQHQDLLNLLLEVFMQNVQRTPATVIRPMAGRIAWCIKSFFTIMLGQEQPFASLFHRLEKVTVFLLHFDEAIDVLAASSTNISQYLWSPTIEQAKQGLMMASQEEWDATVLTKSKRAFISLEKISHHPRACERLVDCNVLQLVNAEWIPSGEMIQRSDTLLVVYALFGRFIASLLHRTAFVRTRLRDELNLFPIIVQLLKEAVTHRHEKRSQWNHVVLGCLAVARTFQYDESSMRIWLQHNQLLPLMLRILLDDVVWRTDARVMLATLGLLEQFSVQPLCGAQVITEEGALMKLAMLLDYLTTADDDDDMNNRIGDDSLDKEEKDGGDDDVEMDDGEKEDDDEVVVNQQQEEEEEHGHVPSEHDHHHHPLDFTNIVDMVLEEGDHPEPYSAQTKDKTYFDCAEFLRKSLVKILTCHDNLQYIILSDAFTQVFRPLTSLYWRRCISKELYQKKMDDLQALYHFTDNTENAIKLHELTAVAIGYAAIGAPTEDNWNTSLGLKQDISVSVFGMLCQMLIDETSSIKRDVAAQVMTSLGLEFKELWDRLDGSSLPLSPPPIPTLMNHVRFKADDSDEIVIANRELLSKQSPIFESMLGTTFVESTLQVIPIHDVTFHHLALFMRVIQSHQIAHIIPPNQDWHSVIRIFQLADRFDTRYVKDVCEHWMMDQIQHPKETTWPGLVSLYRMCRDPHPSEKTTWPFTMMVNTALRSMLLHLNRVCNTVEFHDMIKEDEEAVDMFCDSLRVLIIK